MRDTTQMIYTMLSVGGHHGPAAIKFRNENWLMEKAEDPEKYCIEVIMQEKIKL